MASILPPLIVFDMDGVLVHEDTGILYPQIPEILSELKNQGTRIGVASFNQDPPSVLSKNNILHYVDQIRFSYYEDISKIHLKQKWPLITEIMDYYSLSPNQVIFFDDREANIENVNHHSANTLITELIDREHGLTKNILDAVVERWRNKYGM